MFAADFYKAIKEQATDAAQLDAAEWHLPYTAKIAELAQLGDLPSSLDVIERIDALEAELEAIRSDYVHDLAVAYDAEGNDDAWADAESEAPSVQSLIENYWDELAELGEAA